MEPVDCDSKQVVKCASRADSLPSKSLVMYDLWQMGHDSPVSSLSRAYGFSEGLDAEAACGGGSGKCDSMQDWMCDSFAPSLPSVICEKEVWQTGQSPSWGIGAMV